MEGLELGCSFPDAPNYSYPPLISLPPKTHQGTGLCLFCVLLKSLGQTSLYSLGRADITLTPATPLHADQRPVGLEQEESGGRAEHEGRSE